MKTKFKNLFLLKIGIVLTLLMILICYNVEAESLDPKQLILTGRINVKSTGGHWHSSANYLITYPNNGNANTWTLLIEEGEDGTWHVANGYPTGNTASNTASGQYARSSASTSFNVTSVQKFAECLVVSGTLSISANAQSGNGQHPTSASNSSTWTATFIPNDRKSYTEEGSIVLKSITGNSCSCSNYQPGVNNSSAIGNCSLSIYENAIEDVNENIFPRAPKISSNLTNIILHIKSLSFYFVQKSKKAKVIFHIYK